MNWNKAELFATYGNFSQLPAINPKSTKPEIAFSGRSNVGKSSLINKLLNRKALARVSSTPGKTVTLNFYSVGMEKNETSEASKNPESFFIVDLPGYGYAKACKSEKERFGKLTERYLTSNRVALLIQLIDFRHSPTNDDFTMLDFLERNEIPYIIALTKADKLKKTQRQERLTEMKERFPSVNLIEFSSETGEGQLELRRAIEEFLSDFLEEVE